MSENYEGSRLKHLIQTYNLHDHTLPEISLIYPIGTGLLDYELLADAIYSRFISESHVYIILQKVFRGVYPQGSRLI
jgi:hypothetical protein